MADAADSRKASLAAVARNAAISAFVGLALLFVMFVGRTQFWSWRLALYGALGGLCIYTASHNLDRIVGERIRRRHWMPDKLVGIPLYFLGGWIGFFVVTGVMTAAGLMPFPLRGRELMLALVINGGVSIVVGLLFHSFNVMNRRLRESIEREKEHEFAEKELELARSIQKRLLPPEELSGEGYRIAARNLAARFVAGDFYDVFRLADGALGIAVGDVSGKGIGASLIMASVKAVLPLIAEGRRVAATLSELNRRLAGELASREFVALAFARFEPDTGALELANAGLPDPYLLRPGQVAAPLVVPGPRLPLGARLDVVYESLAATLAPSERLLLLTDGLPEAPAASGDPIGYEVLARLLPSDARTPGELLDRLFASVREASRPVLEDDWTALVLEARPPAEGARG